MELSDFVSIFYLCIPTIIMYIFVLYSPTLASKLISTVCTDFLLNILWSLIYSIYCGDDYDYLFKIFICIVFIIVFAIQSFKAFCFRRGLKRLPPQRDFFESIHSNIGSAPSIKFHHLPSESSQSSCQQSRECSPSIDLCETWQDISPFPEITYCEHLRVKTKTSFCLTPKAQTALNAHEALLQNKYKPLHRKVVPRIQCNNVYDDFVSNTLNKSTGTITFLKSSFARLLYVIAVVFGYRLPFEIAFYLSVKEANIRLIKYIGSKEDNFRANGQGSDVQAQNGFKQYISAVDSNHSIHETH